MTSGSPCGESALVRAILCYCVAHPDAQDSLEGIFKWWLLDGKVKWGREAVQELLDSLVTIEWLTEREVAQSKPVYGINKEQIPAIKAFLRADDLID